MTEDGFIDYYEVLQLDPRAETETIVRVFRHLAKRYHPDNPLTGDRQSFDRIAEAHETLTHPEKRAAYDRDYEDANTRRLSLLDEAIGSNGQVTDQVMRERLLRVLSAQRRRCVEEPALGEVTLESMLDCPRDHLAYHLWYLKEKQWVERTDRGFAITALGVDQVEASQSRASQTRLLPEGAPGRSEDEEPDSSPI